MELRHLRYFVIIAEELNFTKAARRLEVGQPVLSRQIHDPEREIGVQLFDRNSSRVFLTDAGNRFLGEARVVLQHADQAVEVAKQVQAGVAGTLRVAIGKGLGDVGGIRQRHISCRWGGPLLPILCGSPGRASS